jgi:hypothetical protein
MPTVAGDRVVAPGAHRITIGEGQSGTGAAITTGKFTITRTAALPQ